MNTFAILIDAGFVKARLGSADNPTTAEDIRASVQRPANLYTKDDMRELNSSIAELENSEVLSQGQVLQGTAASR